MKCKYLTLLASMGFAAFLLGPSPALAAAVPPLGAAASFGALGGAGVTCTSPNPPLPAITISGGDVGSYLTDPSSVTGFPGFTPGALPCSLDPGRTPLLGQTAAFADFKTAYGKLADIPCPTDAAHILSGNLGGKSLSPGVYCISGVGRLTSRLTLNGGPSDTWIFKAASSLTPIGGSVVMAGGGNACNVYWQLGTAATFDNTDFVGNVLAGSFIHFTGVDSSLVGRALAKTDVTLTGANISACGTGGTPPPSCKPDKHDKRDKHDKHDKQNCNGNHDGHDQDDQDDDEDDDDDHDGGDRHGG